MLRIGKMTDYALLLTNQLVAARDALCTTDDLVAATQLSPATVRRLLKQLVDSGIVTSYRGVKGGYRLANEPAAFTVADVIGAIEGPIALTQCATQKGECELVATCDLKNNWSYVNHMIADLLQHITLADMSHTVSERIVHISPAAPSVAQR
jgi:FeS assembly SUF system regulator